MEHLDVFIADSPARRTRVALVVPKHGHRIVDRNRLKRRVREGARLKLLPVCLDEGAALDIVIRTRPEAYGADARELWEEIEKLAQELCSPRSS